MSSKVIFTSTDTITKILRLKISITSTLTVKKQKNLVPKKKTYISYENKI